MNVIPAFFYYKVRQTVLQSGAALLLQSGAGSITKWSRYYKVGQVLLQSGAGITKWGIITKWCITTLKHQRNIIGLASYIIFSSPTYKFLLKYNKEVHKFLKIF